ncbi:flagellar protein [Niallia endozanthoxylica]|uniref:Flagellar protein n=2 Tax=Niallia endozanthoxylica TaxID=2036016 RepID=A0A5J5HV47_9BACI|nr:flagellar protein [Niallia endozanthoxylica]
MRKTHKTNKKEETSFVVELHSAIKPNCDKLTISKHAQERLEQRGITINAARWEQIDEKVQQAKNMGVKESLVLLEEAALIVSAKNNTVITAMNRAEATTQIFTNINGTILMD